MKFYFKTKTKFPLIFIFRIAGQSIIQCSKDHILGVYFDIKMFEILFWYLVNFIELFMVLKFYWVTLITTTHLEKNEWMIDMLIFFIKSIKIKILTVIYLLINRVPCVVCRLEDKSWAHSFILMGPFSDFSTPNLLSVLWRADPIL